MLSPEYAEHLTSIPQMGITAADASPQGSKGSKSSNFASRLTEPRHDEILIGVSAWVHGHGRGSVFFAHISMQVHQFTNIKGITTVLHKQ